MSTANHIPQEDLALFALQFLPEPEMAETALHLQHCDACRAELANFQGDLAAYALTSELHSPPAASRERLMRRVAKEKKVIPLAVRERLPEPGVEPALNPRNSRLFEMEAYEEPRRSRGAGFAAWSGWAIAAGVIVFAGLQYHQREILQGDLDAVSTKLTQTSSEAQHAQMALNTLTDAGALQLTLHLPVPEGQASKPTPVGHAAYIAEKGALVFVASNLEPLDPYKTYELWVLPASGVDPIPAGIFKPDANGNASVVMPDMPKGVQAKGFGVTIEDDGGSKSGPTKPIVLVGM
jgi:hypothetical protein